MRRCRYRTTSTTTCGKHHDDDGQAFRGATGRGRLGIHSPGFRCRRLVPSKL